MYRKQTTLFHDLQEIIWFVKTNFRHQANYIYTHFVYVLDEKYSQMMSLSWKYLTRE